MLKCVQIKATQKIERNLLGDANLLNKSVSSWYLEQGEMNEQHLPLSSCRV